MRTPAALALLAALPAAGALAADEAAGLPALLESRAPAVVSVRFVVKVRVPQLNVDEERNAEARGVVVDPSGLVLLSNDALEPGAGMFRRAGRRGGGGPMPDATTTPADFKVTFGTDPREHEALLVARETALGLAFVQVLAPEGALATVDLGKGAAPAVGQTLWGVTRKGRAYDGAPVLERAFVAGRVVAPRPMWALGGATTVGLPLYDAEGRPVGVAVRQRGVEGAEDGFSFGGGFGAGDLFVLPLDVVGRAVEAARKQAPAVVEKAKASREAQKAADGAEAAAGDDVPAAPPKEPKPPEGTPK